MGPRSEDQVPPRFISAEAGNRVQELDSQNKRRVGVDPLLARVLTDNDTTCGGRIALLVGVPDAF